MIHLWHLRTCSSSSERFRSITTTLAAARRFFNNAINEFNAAVQQFPAVLFAGMFGFKVREFFDLGEERAALIVAPSVKF